MAYYGPPRHRASRHLRRSWRTVCRLVDARSDGDAVREQGIGVNMHYIPVQTQPYCPRMGLKAEDLQTPDRCYAEAISLPMFQTLTKVQQDLVVAALKKVLVS